MAIGGSRPGTGCTVTRVAGAADMADRAELARPQTQAAVFMLRIAAALFIDWDLEHGLITVRRWNPQSGYRRSTRSYP